MSNIKIHNKLESIHSSCPCYIHTFESGTFLWSSYIKKATDSALESGPIGQCHYNELNGSQGTSWQIKFENNKYLLESASSKYYLGSNLIPTDTSSNKDNYIWIAPAVLVQNHSGTNYMNVYVTLETIGDLCSGHKAEFVLATKGNGNYPSSSSITTTVSEASFATKVASAMTAAGYSACGTLGADEFSTNGNKVTISFTWDPTATEIIYIGIRDKSPTPDGNYSKLRIHEIKAEPSTWHYDIPLRFPEIKYGINSDNGTKSGSIIIKNNTDVNNPLYTTDCMWCWSNGKTFEKIPPKIDKLKSGFYYLKAVNVSKGYTLPIQKLYVPLKKTSSPEAIWPPYNINRLLQKYAEVYNNIISGMKGCASDTMKLTLLDYLYKKFYGKMESSWGYYRPSTDKWVVLNVNYDPGAPYAAQAPYSSNLGRHLGRSTTNMSGISSFYGAAQRNVSLSEYSSCGTANTSNTYQKPLQLALGTSLTNNDSNFVLQYGGLDISGIATIGPEYGTSLSGTTMETNPALDPQALAMPVWNGGSTGSVDPDREECCKGDTYYVRPTIVIHKDKLWELTSDPGGGKTEPGTRLGSYEWKEFKPKKFNGRMSNFKKRLENQRKKSIFELEDKNMLPRGGSDGFSNSVRSRPIGIKYLEMENLDLITSEGSKGRKIV
tara:strand:+ start:312 stop:2297 length:1986 start_codon:yes stop_codon:yes gene_type:complete